MTEIWKVKPGQGDVEDKELVYEVKDTVVVRNVQRDRLILDRSSITARIAELREELDVIDADLVKITQLEEARK